jgi:hypothetical protein
MATWRKMALELFPDLRSSLEAPGTTVMLVFFELGSEAVRAHRADDVARLRAIYSFAERCARQPSKELWNAAGVGFYEHVFDEPTIREKVAAWLPDGIRAEMAGLWEHRLAPADFAAVKSMLTTTAPRKP